MAPEYPTPAMLALDTLLEAARRMRERAQRAPGGVWSADGYGEVVSGKTEPAADDHLSSYYSDRTICRVDDEDFADDDDANRMAEYLASWPPAVALAVADLLEATALVLPLGDDGEPFIISGSTYDCALAVARAYLGDPS